MRFSDGTFWQRALFATLLGVYVFAIGLAVADKLERVGQPDVGWMLDDGYVSPTRRDASQAGLRGGGRAIAINGVPVSITDRSRGPGSGVKTGLGETNRLMLIRPHGEQREVDLPVRPWRWEDVAFTEGATDLIGLLFVLVGVSTFLLRPYEPDSWALLVLSTLGGSLVTTEFLPFTYDDTMVAIYREVLFGFICVTSFHLALAFPVVHPVLRRPARVLVPIYGVAIVKAFFGLGSWYGLPAVSRASGPIGTSIFLVGVALASLRCLRLAFQRHDPLLAQRARICLGGLILGLAPVAVLEVARETFHLVTIDSRFAFWSLAFLLLAVARLTLRQELMNARIAVRRAFLYTLAVAVLTFVAILLSAVRPYAVAVLLFPLLYFWPRFDARLNRVLYPKRARFPELVREIGSEMGLAATIEEALDRLVEAPARLCDAESSVAFLLAGVSGSGEVLRARGHSLAAGPAFAEEPLVQLLVATRKEVLHDRVSVEPHYANIREESLAGFDRLGAEIILPILRDSRVVGGLAIGPRSTGDVYESAELDALSTIIQQFVQAMSRIDATDRLRVREREFGDLKRFFPPQIIDQVMARGGAAELRSQRRLVTVLFADLRGFTSFAETVEPEEVMATLAQFHAAMGRRIAECAGTVERFAGDGIMVFFNDPVDQPDHAERAARMALTMQDDIRRLRREWLEKGYRIDVGVGIDTGYATCGFIGYEGRRDYGVIGSVTNLAARLSDVAGPGEVLITARVRGELGPEFSTMAAGELRLKGFAQPQPAWRLSWASETLKAVPTPIRSR